MPAITDIHGNAVAKPFAWSFSALNNFEQCPKKFAAYSIHKTIKEPENENMRWGFQVHNAMAKRITNLVPLPKEMAPFEKWIDWAMANSDRTQVIMQAERKMAITVDHQPCEFFDRVKKPWFRTVLDVLKVRDKYARIIDWKTGHNVKPDSEQLALAAAVVFAHYPEVDHALCQFVWLQEDQKIEEVVSRSDLAHIWRMVQPKVDAMRLAQEKDDYPPKPSGLCKKYCAVVACPYHGKGAY
jgi:hypothetical protein